MKKLAYIFIFLISFVVFGQKRGKVIRIKDGDTIVVLDSVNVQHTLRLAEVDTPEKKQAFGEKSRQFVANEVFGKVVEFKLTRPDRYGRKIAKVYYDNKYLSEEIIKNGYGWVYYSSNKRLRGLEKFAKENKIGLFSDPNAIKPSEFRKQEKEKRTLKK